MSRNCLMTLLCAVSTVCAQAQIEGVVVDMETRVPIGGVMLTLNSADVSQQMTNYRGEFSIPETIDSLTFGHTGYEARHLLREELTDTVELMRKYRALNEVVIYGNMPQVGFEIKEWWNEIARRQRMVPRSVPLLTFDFFSLFNKKKNGRAKKLEEVMERY